MLDEAARTWKKNGGGVILPGEGNQLKDILRNMEESIDGGKSASDIFRRNDSLGLQYGSGSLVAPESQTIPLNREDSQPSAGLASLDLHGKSIIAGVHDPRAYLRIVGAFDQPRLTYNASHKHFEAVNEADSLLANASQRTLLFRNRYNLIHQRLLRNESFQTSSVVTGGIRTLQRSSSSIVTAQQAYKLTPIANLLGRAGSSHLLLGLLSISPTGRLTLNDLTGSISIDMQHAKPVPEDGAWFTPGMIVLVDGIYEEEETSSDLGLDNNRGVGGTIGGKFVAFSIGGPPCERRNVTLGIISEAKDGFSTAGGGFGWVDFLGVGSERAAGSAMRRLEMEMLETQSRENSINDRNRVVIIGEVQLDNPVTLQALRKIFSLYVAKQADQLPMMFVFVGNFVRQATMTGSGSGGSIEYKEYFDSLASAFSDYHPILQRSTFIFVPGDNDPWPSSFSAGSATALPRSAVPELFTSRIKRTFTNANLEAEKTTGKRTDGVASWTTNPTRLSMFGPTQEIVIFRDDMSSRLRRNAIKFRCLASEDVVSDADDKVVDTAIEVAESHVPVSKSTAPVSSASASSLNAARKLVKTILDQGFLSPFPMSDRPVLWEHAAALQLYPLPTTLVIVDVEAPPFAITYEGCHVMNPGPVIPFGKGKVAQWIEYDSRTRRGKTKEVRY